MKLLALCAVLAAAAAGFLLGIRYAYDDSRRWIVSGDRLQF